MQALPSLGSGVDINRRYVRVREVRANGFVEFEFALGEPHLFVEMLLPQPAFEDFCRCQGVTPTDGALPAAEAGSDAHEWDWSLRAARDEHFRHEPDPTNEETTR